MKTTHDVMLGYIKINERRCKMATPSNKHPEIVKFLDSITDRTDAIKHDRCVKPPCGCGGPATEFRNELSRIEYTVSGLCQKCQDSIFKEGR